ncbi:glycine alanine and asparagine-rich protein-like [Tripterygium wilfordii]|uniref:Glycine alanine and asparagine-rich protein-like n=1 Tax=Tripterygium wilfordii TaxID=458696 RepID=A0A7J7CGT4_TRIWF|nr:glycine alanine and asparagine-rich protein-like [Tripterygium wilfordii]
MCMKCTAEASQGLVVDGGGVKNGMEGMVVGMLGIEGMLGNGGNVTFGIVGILGILGSGGRDGRGSDGIVGIVGCGSDGIVGIVGCGSDGIVGIVGCGSDGIVGIVGCGSDGIVGIVGCGSDGIFGRGGKFGICRRLRAARPTSMLENAKAMKKAIKKYLQQAISVFTRCCFSLINLFFQVLGVRIGMKLCLYRESWRCV